MKGGTAYAKRLRRLFHEWAGKYGKPGPHEPTDPIVQLLIGILAVDSTETKARAVYRKLTAEMVDLNELRVTPAIELAQLIGRSLPHAIDKGRRIVEALHAIRRRQESMDLSFLRHRGRREAREYLESLDGVSPPAAASVMLFSLGGHAIPVDDLTLYVLRKEQLVDPSASAAEVEAFLLRHVHAAEARRFAVLLRRFVSAHAGHVPIERLPALLAPPAPAEPAAAPKAAADTSPPTAAEASKRNKPVPRAAATRRTPSAKAPAKPTKPAKPAKAANPVKPVHPPPAARSPSPRPAWKRRDRRRAAARKKK